MRLVAIANRTLNNAVQAYTEAGVEEVAFVGSQKALENCIRTGRPAVTQDPMLLCDADGIDCLIDVTGAVEHGAQVTHAGHRLRQARGDDERRARRHGRPDPQAPRRQGRRDPHAAATATSPACR